MRMSANASRSAETALAATIEPAECKKVSRGDRWKGPSGVEPGLGLT
jgi:hypothetical protein